MSTRKTHLTGSAWMLVTATLLYYLGTHTFLSVIALFITPVPFALLGQKLGARESGIVAAIYILVAALIDGGFGAIFAVITAAIGLAMAFGYNWRKSAFSAVAAGAGVIFLTFLTYLLIINYGMGYNLVTMLDSYKENFISMVTSYKVPDMPEWMTQEQLRAQLDTQFDMMRRVVPVIMLVTCAAIATFVHLLTRLAGKIFRKEVPKASPIRTWVFPRSVLVYYFFALLIMLMSNEGFEQTLWGSMIENVKVMGELIFVVQGLSFSLYAIYLKKWKIPTPVLVVSLFIFPYVTYILSLLGIFDLGLGLRKRLETRVKRG